MTEPGSRIPTFATREEEAAWWESHDLADLQDEFRTVRARFSRNLSEGITIRLQPDTLAPLRGLAHERGLGPTTLVRMWVLERLREESRRDAS